MNNYNTNQCKKISSLALTEGLGSERAVVPMMMMMMMIVLFQ
jgi:hypothetical protein